MTTSLAMAARQEQELSAAALALAWAERDTLPRAIVDDSLTLIWANRAAEIQFDRRRDLERRERHLACTDPAHHQALADWLYACGSVLCSFSLPCEDGDGHILFRAQEIGWADGVRYFGLCFYRSGSEYTTRYADLDRVFQLTQAETRVLGRLLDGQTADEVTRDLSVSIETTRSHIRQIYAKLGVTSREGMFSRVRPYRL